MNSLADDKFDRYGVTQDLSLDFYEAQIKGLQAEVDRLQAENERLDMEFSAALVHIEYLTNELRVARTEVEDLRHIIDRQRGIA